MRRGQGEIEQAVYTLQQRKTMQGSAWHWSNLVRQRQAEPDCSNLTATRGACLSGATGTVKLRARARDLSARPHLQTERSKRPSQLFPISV